MTMPISMHELNRIAQVRRPVIGGDDVGGQEVALDRLNDVRCRISQPSGVEQIEAQQAGFTLALIVHMRPDANVRRGDRLTVGTDVLRVKSTIQPSEAVYLRADCERVQAEGLP